MIMEEETTVTILMDDNAIKALERKPYEKFESVKDHIYKLAGDYKCWDNRLTQDEALELCHILEQESILDRDCEHCSKTYGTLGCCDTVSNEWVYSCKEGQREYLLGKIEEFLKVIRFALGMRLKDEYVVTVLMDDIEQLLVTYEDEIEQS